MSSNATFLSSFSGGSGTLRSGDNFVISVDLLSDPDGFSSDLMRLYGFGMMAPLLKRRLYQNK